MVFRLVERLENDEWTVVRMSTIKAGDVFRMTERETVLGTFRASKDAEINEGVWGVIAAEVDDQPVTRLEHK